MFVQIRTVIGWFKHINVHKIKHDYSPATNRPIPNPESFICVKY